MTKPYFMTKSTFLLLALTVLFALPVQAASERPNVIVFLVDDMGVMDTSLPFLTDAEGTPKKYPLNDYYRTPSMERLAAQGIRFNQFYAMSVCSPTRISIMTGQNAARHRSTNWINPDRDNRGPQGPPDWNWKGLTSKHTTLPGLLRDAGYRTVHVGKAHFGPRQFEGAEPLNFGFDINVGGCSIGAPASYYGMKNYGHGQAKRAKSAVPHLEKYHETETFLTDALTIEAKGHVSQAVKEKKPFFLYMSHYAVHAPFNSDKRFADHYKDSGKSPNAQAFATLIEGMDKSLGDLIDHVQDLGVGEDTLILFLGDNGSDAPLGHQHAVACAAPLRGKKGAHYEGGMRVPFIAAWANPNKANEHQKRLLIPAGALQTRLGAVTDLFPTVLAVTKTKVPDGHTVDGSDLCTLLTSNDDATREDTFLMHYPHGPHRSNYFTVYREDDWKVIYHFVPSDVSGGSHYQLFNLARDPFESDDVAASEPAQLKRMMAKLTSSLDHHHAVFPVAKSDTATALIPVQP
jgi:arylsulfatase A-like enzyme